MKFSKALVFGFVLLFVIVGCKATEKAEEKAVKPGSNITFDYAAGFVNGTLFETSIEEALRADIFDSNRIYQPERAVIGTDPLIPGLMEALMGMKEGETKNVRIPPEKAYGLRVANATRVVLRHIPAHRAQNSASLKLTQRLSKRVKLRLRNMQQLIS